MTHKQEEQHACHDDAAACGTDGVIRGSFDITATLAALCGGVQCALYVGDDAKALMGLVTDAGDSGSVHLKMMTTLALGADGQVSVGALRAWLAGQTDGLRIVYNGAASPYLCCPLRMGADLVIEDLRAWISPALLRSARIPTGAAFAVIARTQSCWQAMGSVCQGGPPTAWTGTESPALAAALETLSLTEQRRYDTALALAHYLAAHPAVAWVSYPGLPDDAAHPAAQHTLEHGFGPLIACGLRGEKAGAAVGEPDEPDAARTTVVRGKQQDSLIIRTGIEDPFDVVAMVERLISSEARG